MNMLKKVISTLLVAVLIVQHWSATISFASGTSQFNKILESRQLKILEVQPSNNYDLNNYKNADITQMPMTQFIGTIDKINGKYDVIYIGNKSGTYEHFGRKANVGNELAGDNNYYSGNDMTNLKVTELEDYIQSGQLVIYDRSILNNYSTSNVYALLKQYENNYSNVIGVNRLRENQLEGYINQANIRPVLEIIRAPKTYIELDANSYEEDALNFVFNAYTKEDSLMEVNLYLDVDGNGIYEDSEKYGGLDNAIEDGEGYALNFNIPSNYTGVIPWKLELVNLETGTKDYTIGYSAFKGAKQNVRVLQIYPDGNTFSVKNGLMNLLDACSDEYNFLIEEIHVNTFQNRYNNNSNYTINGNYDMLILGFADIYGNNDITNTRALNDIERFIETGQSVMFTHDTMTFRQSGWAAMLTERFRNIVGQNRFMNDAYPNNRFTYGFSDMALLRAETYNFDTTTRTIRLNEGLITRYPYDLDDIRVQTTHYQYYQLDLEDEEIVTWFTLDKDYSYQSIDPLDPRNYYYTYSKGNITYSGTGHANLSQSGFVDERKLFVNTIVKAARGANHAPTIKVDRVIRRDDKLIIEIPTGYTTAEFDFTAIDLDKGDELLNGRIYIDKNQDGHYASDELVQEYRVGSRYNPPLISTKKETVVLDNIEKEWFKNNTVLKLKIEVYDEQNAISIIEIEIHQVDKPVFNLQASKEGGLIGDEVDYATLIKLHMTDQVNEKKIENLSIHREIEKDGEVVALNQEFDWVNYGQWEKGNYSLETKPNTIKDIEILPSGPSWYEETINMKFIPKAIGTYDIISELTYDLEVSNTNEKFTAIHPFEVKEGKIFVQVKDDGSKSIDNAQVTITNMNTNKVIYGSTDVSGMYRVGQLPSGTYEVKVGGIPSVEVLTLDYEHPTANLTFIYNANYFENVQLLVKDRMNLDTNRQYIKDTSTFEALLKVDIKEHLQGIMVEINCVEPSEVGALVFDYEIRGSSQDRFELVNIEGISYIKSKDGIKISPGPLEIHLYLTPRSEPEHGQVYRLLANKFILQPLGSTASIERSNTSGALFVECDKIPPKIEYIISPHNRLIQNISDLSIQVSITDENTELVKVYWNNDGTRNYMELGSGISMDRRSVEFTPPRPNRGGYYSIYAEDLAGNQEEIQIFINVLGLPDLI